MHYSALQILKNGLTGNKNWKPVWRDPEPKKSYDIIIIGGGGHGLATAYYLAKTHGIRNIAVLEKGTWAVATLGAIPLLSGPTIFWTGTSNSILILLSFGKTLNQS